jgi:uncharacterized protein DUF6570
LNRKRSVDDTLTFFDGRNIHKVFEQYSIANLNATCRLYNLNPRSATRSAIYALICQAPSSVQDEIRRTAVEAMQNRNRTNNERTHAFESNQSSIQSNIALTNRSDMLNDNEISELLCENAYMKAPDKQVIDSAIAEFIDRTGNAALTAGVCAVCARETIATDLSSQRLDSIPNPHLLKPITPHRKHDIFNGMLLHPRGLSNDESGDVCVECLRALKADKIPMFALANGLWIGGIPHELAYLTLPERLLIAKFFPAAYIFKLYPKKKGARHWDNRQMYSGLRGNVSTYQLDQSQITSMIDGTIMPQSANVLAATIGVTFVGPKNLPEKTLPDMFRVRRTRVKRALEWLKENNPLFANITISVSRLAELPDDDVPYELLSTAKHSTDIDMVYAEQEGYVPSQDASDGEVDEGMENFIVRQQRNPFSMTNMQFLKQSLMKMKESFFFHRST